MDKKLDIYGNYYYFVENKAKIELFQSFNSVLYCIDFLNCWIKKRYYRKNHFLTFTIFPD